MKIKNIEFKNNILLAPMAGVTDVAFRSICIDFGADAGVTEMISAKALKYENKKTEDLLITAPNEKIKIVQIFGSDPDIMAEICASKYLEKFDIIDINMGCPAPKIVSNGEGSFLMTKIDLAREIISKCVSATNKPITVKFRSGFDNNSINAIEFAKMCESAGASAITIHGRTRSQMYSGSVDLDIIRSVKQSVNIPVIASGDIVDRESYLRTLKFTGCDAVMIGRGALGNPYIFEEIRGIVPNKHKIEIIKRHIETLLNYYPLSFVSGHIRKHLLWYLKGERGASEIKKFVSLEPDLEKILTRLKDFFDDLQN
ncbi:MAG TPA: tRNA dihydrouridine synthase DusB [Clostridiales bacterium]|nr:tRNA dihydrouridine synthase DusB [Clostridiales bacterium]